MSKLTYRISYYALYAMFAVILIVLGLFYLGGDAQGADVVVGRLRRGEFDRHVDARQMRRIQFRDIVRVDDQGRFVAAFGKYPFDFASHLAVAYDRCLHA